MKTVAVLACLVASAAAFSSPMMATRAVGKKAAPKKAAAAPTVSFRFHLRIFQLRLLGLCLSSWRLFNSYDTNFMLRPLIPLTN